jgi:hypothetical protein
MPDPPVPDRSLGSADTIHKVPIRGARTRTQNVAGDSRDGDPIDGSAHSDATAAFTTAPVVNVPSFVPSSP